ncbi:LOW QUALITY PROTEIN: hypothetical protein PHMEG_00034240, partial [Phytophthora megakarya]
MFVTNEVDESVLVPVFDRRSFVDDIWFGGKPFDDCLTTLDCLLARFTECRISISFTKSIFVQPRVEFLSHEVSHEGIRANTKKLATITKLSIPRTKRGMQSFLGALNYYSRFIQDFAVFGAALCQLKDDDFEEDGDLTTARRSFDMLKQKPKRRSFGTSTKRKHCMKTSFILYHPAEKEVLALLLLMKTCYTQLAGRTLHVYTRLSTLEWITKSKALFGSLFRRAVQWAVLLSPWHLIVQRIKEKECAFTRLLQSTVTNFVDIDESLELVAPPQKESPTARIGPQLLYAKLPLDYSGLVVSFDWSAKAEKNVGYGSCAWV